MTLAPRLACFLALLAVSFAAAPRSPSAEDAGLKQRVTVKVSEAPLTDFLDTLSAQAKVNFILKEGFEKERVTAYLEKVTVGEALDVVAEAKGLQYRRLQNGDTFIVERKAAARAKPRLDAKGLPDARVSVKVKGVPLSRLIAAFSEQAKVNFILADGLSGRRVTAHLENVRLAEALEIVLELKDLSCRRGKSGAYIIEPG